MAKTNHDCAYLHGLAFGLSQNNFLGSTDSVIFADFLPGRRVDTNIEGYVSYQVEKESTQG